MPKKLMKVTIQQTQTTDIYVDAFESGLDDVTARRIVDHAVNKAGHEIEWYSGNVSLWGYQDATAREKHLVEESNEPVYDVATGEWN